MDYIAVFTIAIIAVTALVSHAGIQDDRFGNKLVLWPIRMHDNRESYRLLSSGFVHADYQHLLWNMLALYFMGSAVERAFSVHSTPWTYILMYLTAIVAAALPSFAKNRNNPAYRALGASGAVSAVVFASVYFAPWGQLNFMFLPGIPVYNIVFAVLYLLFSAIVPRLPVNLSARLRGNRPYEIGHDAHFWGAVYGFLFTLAVDPTHGRSFLEAIQRTPW